MPEPAEEDLTQGDDHFVRFGRLVEADVRVFPVASRGDWFQPETHDEMEYCPFFHFCSPWYDEIQRSEVSLCKASVVA